MEEAFQLALDSAPFLLKGAYYTVILSLGGMFSACCWALAWR